mgnify:CR=1 FL=1
MSGKITGYDPKTQNFIDTDLFDVSKHETQTSGVLEVGVSYTIITFVAGDNFTNVGGTNVTGAIFTATGTTPTTYTNGSTLAKYVTQSYTYAELKSGLGLGSKIYKASLNQTSTNAPVEVELVNTLGGTPVLSYVGVGDFLLTLNGEFPDASKVIILGTPLQNDTTYAGVNIFWNDADSISIQTFKNGASVNDLLIDYSIVIEVFP